MKAEPFAAVKGIAAGLLHLAIAVVAVPVITAASFFALRPLISFFVPQGALDPRSVLTLPLFPLQSISGFAIGFFVARRGGGLLQNKIAWWIWAIPALWFLVLFAAWPGERWVHFVWSNSPRSKTEQFFTTLPLLTSITYALGSAIGVRTASKQRNSEASKPQRR
jgi:hypothetical protein